MEMKRSREESDLWIISGNFLQVMINAEWTIHWHYQWLFSNKSKISVWILIKRATKCPKSVGTYVQFFFHSYKNCLSCCELPELKSICRQKYWHSSSLIQESKGYVVWKQASRDIYKSKCTVSNWPTTTTSWALTVWQTYAMWSRWLPVFMKGGCVRSVNKLEFKRGKSTMG